MKGLQNDGVRQRGLQSGEGSSETYIISFIIVCEEGQKLLTDHGGGFSLLARRKVNYRFSVFEKDSGV